MLSHLSARSPGRVRGVGLALLAGAVLILTGPATAQNVPKEVKKDDKSALEGVLKTSALAKVPQDASFFASTLRNREQLDRFLDSRAYKALSKMPAYRLAVSFLKNQLEEAGMPVDVLDKLFAERGKKQDKDKDKKEEKKTDDEELAELLIGSLEDEVFVYGGRGWTDLQILYNKAQKAANKVAIAGLADGDNDKAGKAAVREMLLEAQKGREAIGVPELVIGFRTKEAKKLQAQVERLEKPLAALVDRDERLKGKLKREGGMLTLQVDGSLVPWDDIPLGEIGDRKDFKDLFDHLKKSTLSVSVGVRGDYVLLALGRSVKDLDKLDKVMKGKTLADRLEMQPLAKNATKKITSVNYISKEFLESIPVGYDVESLAAAGKSALEKHVKKEDLLKEIKKDVDGLVAELKKWSYPVGARMGFSFMTPEGYEAFNYDFGKFDFLKGNKTNLFDHVESDPIFAAAFGFQVNGTTYATLSKYVKTFHGHAESVFLSSDVDDNIKNEYKKHSGVFLPLFKKADENITKNLIPSLKGQSGLGIVVDGKWKSKKWAKELPELKRDLPMLELGLLVGINDRDKFATAMKEFRTTFNDLYAKARELDQTGQVPDFKLDEPKKIESRKGLLYTWPVFKDAGLDEQVQLTAGLGKKVAVLALSKSYAEALMTPTKLDISSGPLVTHRDRLIAGTLLNFPQFVDVVQAWTDAVPELLPAETPEGVRKIVTDQLKQVREVYSVLKCFNQMQSATYLDGSRLVTHTRFTFKDLEESPEPPKKN